ncbi:MAG: hypothetical protein QNK30_02325 [Bacteroidales bacterium]|nr:hypothetical protein [Bacteroidales bacterium]
MDTLQIITTELGKAFSTVGQSLQSPFNLKKLINTLGWDVPPGFNDAALAGANVSEVTEKLKAIIESTPEEREDDMLMISRTVELTAALIKFINQVIQVVDNLDSTLASLGDYVTKTKIKEDFFKRMLDLMIMSYISGRSPDTYSIIQFLSIFEQKSYPADSSIYQIEHVRYVVHYDRIGTLFSDPGNLMNKGYGWGTANFDTFNFLKYFAFLVANLGTETHFNQMSRKVEEAIFHRTVPEADTNPATRAVITILRQVGFELGAEIKLVAYQARPTSAGATDGGIGFFPIVKGTTDLEFDIADNLKLFLEGEIDFSGAVNLILRPDQTPVIETGMYSGAASLPLAAKILAGLIYGSDSSDRITILSFPGGSKLDLQKTSLKLGVEKEMSGSFGPLGEVAVKDMKLMISLSSADSFLKEGVGSEDFTASFDLTVGWSKNGIYFKGSASLEIQLPVHIELGPIELSNVTAALKTKNEGFAIELGTTIKLELGPLSIVVENIGAKADIAFEESSGNLGPFNFKPGFKPPNGLGLTINAGAVIGGGYLFFDIDKEEYAGVLELTIAEFISVKAIGLITTKMPDGSKGFSMLIIITAEFNPPFQLGYGFTLIGVGGLLGLNRTVLLNPLRDGVRTGAVNNIMFPTNVVANAPRIISDLKTIFPPYVGKFLIGPMGKAGYGTPTLISLSLGLIIEIPGNFAILGVLKLILPHEKAPIVKIQVAFVGTIDFDKKLITFDASLYESSILQTLTLEGDMALRLAWGDQPNFLMTVGGFHPSFTPPPLALPTLKRLAINILNTSVAKIRVECYQAVTSNTVQFGAKAEIKFDLKACDVKGHIAFDALFQFDPFYFIIMLSAGFKLSAVGISLMTVRVKMSLEGPTPWHAKGTGKVSLLFFDISANFDKTWGKTKNTSLPSINILPKFLEQLQLKENWSTALTTSKNLSVTLRKIDEANESLLVLHPAGSLTVVQKLLPLKVDIDRIGNQKTADVKQLHIDSASSNGTSLTLKEVKENFARAQYQKLSDAKKLSKPSFEKMQGGVEISMGNATFKNGTMVRRNIEYELKVVDKEPIKPLPFGKFFAEIGLLFVHLLKGNSVSKSVMSQSYKEKLQPFADKLDIQEESFTVAYQLDNKIYNNKYSFPSEMEAETYMQQKIQDNPALANQVHIIPQYELQES